MFPYDQGLISSAILVAFQILNAGAACGCGQRARSDHIPIDPQLGRPVSDCEGSSSIVYFGGYIYAHPPQRLLEVNRDAAYVEASNAPTTTVTSKTIVRM